VPGVSVFYSVQPLKGRLGFEEIDALITSTPEEAFRLRSGRDLEARNMPQEHVPLSRQIICPL